MKGPAVPLLGLHPLRWGPVLLASVMMLSACAGSDPGRSSAGPTTTASPETAAASTTGSVMAGSDDAVVGSIERRIGGGRATAASTGGGSLVVGTTIGAQVRRGDDVLALPIDRVDRAATVAVSPDGQRALVGWPGSTELWDIGAAGELLASWSAEWTARFDEQGRAVLSTADSIEVVGLDGGLVGEIGAGPDRTFGPVEVDPVSGLVVAAFAGPAVDGVDANLLVGPIDGEPGPITLAVDGADAVDEVAIVPGGGAVMLGMTGEEGIFDRTLVRWVPRSGSDFGSDPGSGSDSGEVGWTIPLDPDDAWAVDPAGTVLIAGPEGVRVVEPGGQVRSVDPPGGDRARSIHPLGGGGFVIVQFGTGWVVRDGTGAVVDGSGGEGAAIASVGPAADGGVVLVDGLGAITLVGRDGSTAGTVTDLVAGIVNDLAVLDDRMLAVADSSGTVRIAPLAEGGDEVAGELSHPEGNVDSVAFSPDGSTVVTGVGQRRGTISFDDTVVAWDRATGDRLWESGGEAEDVAGCSTFGNDVGLSVDGALVIGLSHDYSVQLIDRATGRLVREIDAHDAPIRGVAHLPRLNLLATSSEDSKLRVRAASTGDLLVDQVTPLGGFRSLAFLPDGTRLVGTDSFGEVSLIDSATGSIESTFSGAGSPNADLAVSPDGRLVGLGDESVLRLWSTTTGEIVGGLAGHTGLVRTAVFTPDGSYLITGAGDGTAVVWELTGS